MKKNKAYLNLLNKMLVIENIGEVLYKALISKGKNKNLKSIYERLALNERETAKYIEKELSARDRNISILIRGTILSVAKLICSLLTARQLNWVLKSALKRRIYSRWCNVYQHENQEFWRLLLNHENLQHELLSPSRNN